MKAFLTRLKERKVIRVTGVYAVSGYTIFQIADNMLPALNLPPWTVTFVAVIFLLGFPIVIASSYLYDWTATGLERAPPDDPSLEPGRLGWLNWSLLAATGAVLVAFAAFYITVPDSSRDDPAALAATDRSIAVLPFEHFGDSAEMEYFADGLTEELINWLAQLPELKVAGRTSSFYFKGSREDLREVGRKLGVAHVLEGSVRRSGDNLRITAQLIQVADGFHLYSEQFDRKMDDALAIQTQIARAVAERLEARLLRAPSEARSARAYELELVARSRLRKQELRELEAARALYRELIAIEPSNASAHAGFAEATITLAQGFLTLDLSTARAEAEVAIETALRLAPESSEAWRVRGFLNRVLAIRTGEQRYADSALADLQRAVDLDPRNADALAQLASQLLTAGRVEQAAATVRRSLEIDPLSRMAQQLLGTALERQGRFGEARRQYESLIELYPDFTNAKIALAMSLMAQGKLDEAVVLLDDRALTTADPIGALMLANCYANLGLRREFRTTLEAIVEPRVPAMISRLLQLMQFGDAAELSDFVASELDVTDEPLWRSVRLLLAVRDGDPRAVEQALVGMSLGSADTEEPLDRSSAMDALLIAEGLRLSGKPEQAEGMIEALLRRFESASGEYVSNDVLVARAFALAFLGRTDAAIDDLSRAAAQGYRMLVDFEYFLRPEDYPFMRDVVQDSRYVALVAMIEADNARMREALRREPARNRAL